MVKFSYSGVMRLTNGEYETYYKCSGPIPTNAQRLIDRLLDLEKKHLTKNVRVVPKSIEVKVTIEI